MAPIFFIISFGCFLTGILADHHLPNETASTQNCGSGGTVCHGIQKNCWENSTNACEVLAKITPDGDSVLVDLSAHVNGENLHLNFTNRWIGVGFSLSGKMPNAAVVHCINDGNNTVHAKLTYNLPDRHFNIGWKDVDQSALQAQLAKLDNDQLHCVVKLKKSFKIKDNVFDLSKSHTLLAATGPLQNGTIARHDRKPIIADKPASF